jgi:long-chain fatty acid transport protein
MKSLRRSAVAAGALTCAAVVWTRGADASGFASQRIGGEDGSVVATNPTALYFNPGGLGFSKGSQLGLYFSGALRHVTWTHAAAATDTNPDPAIAQGANTGEAHLFNIFGGPSFGGSIKLGNLVLGGGFFAPFFGSAHWSQNDTLSAAGKQKYPFAADGVQRWFGIDASLGVLYFTAGAAYRLGPLSIGATGNFISSFISTVQAKSLGGAGLPDTTHEGRAGLDVNGFNGSFAAGAMLEAVPDQVWIGGSYQAQPGLGQQSLDGTLAASQLVGPPLISRVTLYQSLPDVIRGGVRYRPKGTRFEFRLFGDYTRWSVLKTQCLTLEHDPCTVDSTGADVSAQKGIQANYRRNWNDTYGGRLGVSYWVKPEIELQAGGGYETAAVPDSTMSPDLTDANNIAATLGARFMLLEALYFGVSYTHLQYLNRDNTGKSTLALQDAANNVYWSVPTVIGDGGGQYTQWIDELSVNLEALF